MPGVFIGLEVFRHKKNPASEVIQKPNSKKDDEPLNHQFMFSPPQRTKKDGKQNRKSRCDLKVITYLVGHCASFMKFKILKAENKKEQTVACSF